jgi:hypothetical protein
MHRRMLLLLSPNLRLKNEEPSSVPGIRFAGEFLILLIIGKYATINAKDFRNGVT